jgi:hypothetical protein
MARFVAARLACAFLVLFLGACSTGRESSPPPLPYHERALHQAGNGLVVEAAALSRAESIELFGVPLNDIDVQPVWLNIASFRADPLWLFPLRIDADYFPVYEVARRASSISGFSQEELASRLQQEQFELFIPPGESRSGFVFAHSDEGMKTFNVELNGPAGSETFNFVVPVPGLPTHYFSVDGTPANGGEQPRDLDLDELRDWLTTLDCCTVDAAGRAGDPLNLVFVGDINRLRAALISQHWDVTAPVTSHSLRRIASAFIFGSRYRYAPISPLHLFGREQDLAFQRSRAVIDERNHMRVWLAPVTVDAKPVWVGQVSRDIGLKISGRLWPPVTHIIDPDVDDARFYVLQGLVEGEHVRQIGFVRGHEPTIPSAPYFNAEGDPYFTDGLRAVFMLADEPVAPSDFVLLDWELPPEIEPYRAYYVK